MTDPVPAPRCGSCRSPVTAGARFCSSCGAVLGGHEQVDPEGRKNVAVLFVDLVGSTALAETLDPEVIRGVLDRYYAVCADAVAAHGGVVEKYIGDAIMAIFGVPTSREDDALRAVRAAFTAVEAVGRLGRTVSRHGIELSAHAGVGSGEVVVVAAPGVHLRVIGDPVNTAARLESAAGAGELLVNAEVAQLVRPYVTLEPVAPLDLKGKAAPVQAWRVTSLTSAASSVDQIPLVGRDQELAALMTGYREMSGTGTGRRALVLGPAGIGKSRLLREFLAVGVDRGTTVLTGVCQPYGKDITYQPLASMLAGSATSGGPLGDETDGPAARVLETVLGGGSPADRGRVGAEDIELATASVLRSTAGRGPVVVVWEDLHWAEPALLHLIDEVGARLSGVPVLQVCVARNEVNGWADGGDWDERIDLGPLDDGDTHRLVAALVAEAGDEVTPQAVAGVDQIVRSCEGNPLFATVMAESVAGSGALAAPTGEVTPATLPPTVAAVLRARIDALPRTERQVLQMASVCGREFGVDELAQIGGPGDDHTDQLASLCRRRLLFEASPGRFRFDQTLLHDTAYAALPKAQRARWHVALSRAPGGLGEIYHAEAACQLFGEIAPDEPDLPGLVDRTVGLLLAEGTVALHRKDLVSAEALLHRALALAPPTAQKRVAIVLRLSDARLLAGDSEGALDVLSQHPVPGPRTIALQRGIAMLRFGATAPYVARQQIEDFRAQLVGEPGDLLGWCLLHQFEGFLELGDGHGDAAEAAFRAALDRAGALGDRYTEDRLLAAVCELVQWSHTDIGEGLRLCDELAERLAADRVLLVPVLAVEARLLAMTGAFDRARAVLGTATELVADLGAGLASTAVDQAAGYVHAAAGDHDEAIRLFEQAARELRVSGHRIGARGLEMRAVLERIRAGQMLAAATTFGRLAVTVDVGIGARDPEDAIWSGLVEARLIAADGRHDEAVELAGRTLTEVVCDDPCLLGDAWFEYAGLLRAADRHAAAVEAAQRALGYFQDKGATHPAAQVRAWLGAEGSG